MYKIFVDLEMHPIPRILKEERKICTQEIIEIGAVKLNEENEEISSFCEFVKPGYVSKIYSKFQKLTGIRTEDIAFADLRETAVDWYDITHRQKQLREVRRRAGSALCRNG